MKAALTAAEIAQLGLPGLNPTRPARVIGTDRGVLRYAARNGWPSEKRPGKGGGKVYPIAGLPKLWREALTAAIARGVPEVLAVLGVAPIAAVAAPAGAPTLPVAAAKAGGGPLVRRVGRKTVALRAPVAGALTERQRRVRDARAAVLVHIDRLRAAGTLKSAIAGILGEIATGTLRSELMALVMQANDRSKDARLCTRTINSWLSAREEGGVDALAPRVTAEIDTSIPAWAPFYLTGYQQPQKPSLKEVHRTIALPEGVVKPHYDQVRRFFAKLAPYSLQRGRHGPNALRQFRAYTARDISGLWPTAVYIADGHTFKAKVQHPDHGQPFQPEITTVMDVGTRAVVGWSIGIIENSIGVLEALSSAMAPGPGRPGGVPAIFYSDLGKGFKNGLMSSAITGFHARWGIEETHSRARNSEARGVIEHFHATVYTPAAKSLVTFCGSDMDKDALRLIKMDNDAAERAKAALPFSVTWTEFEELIRQRVDRHNNSPHSALPKVPDAESGRDRHMTPLEGWAAGLARGGYQPIVIQGDDVADLYRPVLRRMTRGGTLSLLGNGYYAKELEQFHKQYVDVGFDINDPSKVWVRDCANKKLLAVAELNGHVRPYFQPERLAAARASTERAAAARGIQPRSFREITEDRRKAGRLELHDAKREVIVAEGAPRLTLAATTAEPVALSEAQREVAETLFLKIAAKRSEVAPAAQAISDGERPWFNTDIAKVRWLATHPGAITIDDRAWLMDRLETRLFRMQLEFEDDLDFDALVTMAQPVEAMTSAAVAC